MNYLKISLAVFLALAASRFIPHPPNFTSLIALSFYVPAMLGIRFIPVVMISFVLTDFIIGLHSTTFFTWGSVLVIGFLSNYFSKSILKRISGALLGAVLFYIISNFGVWINGFYGYSLEGLITCYTLAIPFFTYTLLSTLLYSFLIEVINSIYSFDRIKN